VVGYGPAKPCRLARRGARRTPPPSRPRVQCGCKPLSGFKRAEGEIFKCEVVWRFGNTRSEETPPRAGHRHRAEASLVESEPDASRQRLIAAIALLNAIGQETLEPARQTGAGHGRRGSEQVGSR
jgi:hypothetical protein